eukprot:359707-Chlamydomonas_euryale.AAC.2
MDGQSELEVGLRHPTGAMFRGGGGARDPIRVQGALCLVLASLACRQGLRTRVLKAASVRICSSEDAYPFAVESVSTFVNDCLNASIAGDEFRVRVCPVPPHALLRNPSRHGSPVHASSTARRRRMRPNCCWPRDGRGA